MAQSVHNIVLQRLIVADDGLVFDPVGGKTFTANETGLLLLRLLQQRKSLSAIVRTMKSMYQVTSGQATHEIREFCRFLQDTISP